MELMPIIKASLGIFALLTSITFVVSFVVYKIKNRNCIKPYQREPRIFDSSLILEVHDSQEGEKDNKSNNSKFRILNEITQKQNSFEPNNFIKETVPEKINNNYVAPKIEKRSANEVFNIYSFYSNDDLKTMHKLRVKPATAD
jgi:hypothetical protein